MTFRILTGPLAVVVSISLQSFASPPTLTVIMDSISERGFKNITPESDVREILEDIELIIGRLEVAQLKRPRYRSTMENTLVQLGCTRLIKDPVLRASPANYTPRCIANAIDAAILIEGDVPQTYRNQQSPAVPRMRFWLNPKQPPRQP